MIYKQLTEYLLKLEEIAITGSEQNKKISTYFLNKEVTTHNAEKIEKYINEYERNR